MESPQQKQQLNHLKKFLEIVEPEFFEAYEAHKFRSTHSPEALYSAWLNVRYVCKAQLSGDVLEFGTWKGGTLAVMAAALNSFAGRNRLIGFDTFSGYPKPTSSEMDVWGKSMLERWERAMSKGEPWGQADQNDVRAYIDSVRAGTALIKGEINANSDFSAIKEISYLRLDMNWYEPTIAALRSNFHKIQKGGCISIVYGHHSGARRATDEFFNEVGISLNFQHVNYSNVTATVI